MQPAGEAGGFSGRRIAVNDPFRRRAGQERLGFFEGFSRILPRPDGGHHVLYRIPDAGSQGPVAGPADDVLTVPLLRRFDIGHGTCSLL